MSTVPLRAKGTPDLLPNQRYTDEAANVAAGSDATQADIDPKLLEYEEEGDFFALLMSQDFSLCVSREYEHFLVTIDFGSDGPAQSPFPLPHPSGFWFDPETRELIVSSTRTPNILLWMSPYSRSARGEEIRPLDVDPPPTDVTLFLPRKAIYLPGSLYIHDLVKVRGQVHAAITGHNLVARCSDELGFERVWWPEVLDGLDGGAFRQNFLQLNSIAVGDTVEQSFFTAFSDQTSGPKPWKAGYGPRGKGVVFAGETRRPLVRGLTCPHSARIHAGKLWLCDSGYGYIGYVDSYESLDEGRTKFVPVAKAPGFTRGLAFAGDYVFVGVSRVIKQYEPYAPGLEPERTRCGVWVFDWRTGREIGSLSWTQGYQIYDVQVLFGVKKPRLPLSRRDVDGINPYLRFLA
jgi:uncharacterized protein (TIGR03032 family)